MLWKLNCDIRDCDRCSIPPDYGSLGRTDQRSLSGSQDSGGALKRLCGPVTAAGATVQHAGQGRTSPGFWYLESWAQATPALSLAEGVAFWRA